MGANVVYVVNVHCFALTIVLRSLSCLRLRRRGLRNSLKRDVGWKNFISSLSKPLFSRAKPATGCVIGESDSTVTHEDAKTNPTDTTPSFSEHGRMTTAITDPAKIDLVRILMPGLVSYVVDSERNFLTRTTLSTNNFHVSCWHCSMSLSSYFVGIHVFVVFYPS